MPEDAVLSAEIPQPTASGVVPEWVASLDAMNISEDLGKKPISPTVLTQVKLVKGRFCLDESELINLLA